MRVLCGILSDLSPVEGLIADLAWILLLGAFVTLLFKRLKQPVVLGYILAGFLASPKFTWLPSISTLENIEFWAKLGIVVLMFTLGLEFSFKKLVKAGASSILTAFIIITGMTFAGYGVGRFLDLGFTSSIFLGGMLSMSSTTIILKAFTDLGIKQKKFASLVLAVLIIEDLFAVLMLVLLSSFAAGGVDSTQILTTIGRLVFYLIIWYVVGVWFIPSFFRRARSLLNDETLLVISMGLCFSTVVGSVMCGFSLELGAFIAGSIIAGTFMAERIERVVQPVKDLFGAVFFISVGMMVEPIIIAGYWDTIIILAVVVICGMIIFGTFGMLLTGQNLRVAIESGFALTQIGEFSFIIASLGMAAGVLDEALYPIIVSVSVITIFTTPYFIRMADSACDIVERHLPSSLHFLINRYTEARTDSSDARRLWKSIVVRYLWRIVLFPVILTGIIITSRTWLYPMMRSLSPQYGVLTATILTLLAMSPFLASLTISASSKRQREKLQEEGAGARVPLTAMKAIRYLIALYFVLYLLSLSYSMSAVLLLTSGIVILAAVVALARSTGNVSRMERRFMSNLNSRENIRSGREHNVVGDLHLAHIEVSAASPFVGDRIADSGLRRDYGISISSISRGMRVMPLPASNARIFPGDILGIIGTDEQIKHLLSDIDLYESQELRMDHRENEERRALLFNVILSSESPIAGKTLAQSRLREDYFCMLLKVTRDDDTISAEVTPELILEPGDRLWLVGDPDIIPKLK